MEAIDIPVYVTSLRACSGAVMAEGCRVPIRARFRDWQLAPGDRVVAYAKQDGEASRAECVVNENTAAFVPPDGFFQFGNNNLQFEINDKIITLPAVVVCRRRVNKGG